MESKVIQEGSYGCVVSPPLKCKKSKKRSERSVGKIIKIKNSRVELSMATLVKGIPGWTRYYILQEDDKCDSKNLMLIVRYMLAFVRYTAIQKILSLHN